MKLLSCAACIVVCVTASFSQIPNNGFEDWATDGDGNNNPVGWETTNSSPYVSVEPFTPAYQGNYAMRVKTVDVGGFVLPGAAILAATYSFSEIPTRFGAWVRSAIMPGDTVILIVGLVKGETVVAATDSCTFKISTSYAEYTYLEFPIRTVSNEIPDSMYVMVTTSLQGTPQVGTEVIVDNLVFLNTVTNATLEAGLPGSFLLGQNYPNPFNPATTISFDIPAAGNVILTVYDLLGREVAVLASGFHVAGSHVIEWNAGNLPSGAYVYQLRSGSLNATRRLMLMK